MEVEEMSTETLEVLYTCPRCRRQSVDTYKDEEVVPNCMRYKQKNQQDLVIMLTPMEAELISILLVHEGQVISTDRLIYNLYHNGIGLPYHHDTEPNYPINSIRVVLNRIRKKFNRYTLPIEIKTVYGRGLKITAPKDQITMECI